MRSEIQKPNHFKSEQVAIILSKNIWNLDKNDRILNGLWNLIQGLLNLQLKKNHDNQGHALNEKLWRNVKYYFLFHFYETGYPIFRMRRYETKIFLVLSPTKPWSLSYKSTTDCSISGTLLSAYRRFGNVICWCCFYL